MKKTLRTKLQEIRNISTMENASFHADKLPIVLNSQAEANTFIKKTIRIWISTWITGALDTILKEYK